MVRLTLLTAIWRFFPPAGKLLVTFRADISTFSFIAHLLLFDRAKAADIMTFLNLGFRGTFEKASALIITASEAEFTPDGFLSEFRNVPGDRRQIFGI
jgi:hypothetical protein